MRNQHNIIFMNKAFSFSDEAEDCMGIDINDEVFQRTLKVLSPKTTIFCYSFEIQREISSLSFFRVLNYFLSGVSASYGVQNIYEDLNSFSHIKNENDIFISLARQNGLESWITRMEKERIIEMINLSSFLKNQSEKNVFMVKDPYSTNKESNDVSVSSIIRSMNVLLEGDVIKPLLVCHEGFDELIEDQRIEILKIDDLKEVSSFVKSIEDYFCDFGKTKQKKKNKSIGQYVKFDESSSSKPGREVQELNDDNRSLEQNQGLENLKTFSSTVIKGDEDEELYEDL